MVKQEWKFSLWRQENLGIYLECGLGKKIWENTEILWRKYSESTESREFTKELLRM